MTLTLQGTTVSRTPTLNGGLSVAPTAQPNHTSSRASVDSAVAAWRREIDNFYVAMKQFPSNDGETILMSLSAFSARANEIRLALVRTETRQYTAFRTKEIDPFIEEVDRQFKVWSRFQSVRQMEWEVSRG